MNYGLHDFFGFLMEGLKVTLYALQHIEFTIQTNTFSLLDAVAYSGVIGATLSFISTRYQGSWKREKQINRKVNR